MVKLTTATARGDARAGWLLIALVALAFLMGGGSRSDITSLVVLRPLSAIIFTAALGMLGGRSLKGFAAPLGILAGWFLLVLFQLIPLPPVIWTVLPGREVLADNYTVLGIAPGWKPLSVGPMATLNSLLSLFVPLAALMLYAIADDRGRQRTLAVVVGFIGFSALLGVAQVVTGSDSLYTYRITNAGFPVGLFANRNHQAVLIAAAIPMVLALTAGGRVDSATAVRRWGGRLAALAFTTVAVMTGSRTGAILALSSLAVAVFLFADRDKASAKAPHGWRPIARRLAGPAVVALAFGAMLVFAKGTAFERMAEKDSIGDLRFQILPAVWRMITDSFPVGFGFGTFTEAYKIYEPANIMIANYINRAHDDWLEIVVEGGLAAVLLAIAMVTWGIRRCWQMRDALTRPRDARERMRAAAAIGLVVLVAASLFDYPLRTPAGAVTLAVLLGCLASPRIRA